LFIAILILFFLGSNCNEMIFLILSGIF